MNCNKLHEWLNRTQLSGIPEHYPADVKKHITECASCLEEFQSALKIGKLLENTKIPEMQSEYWDNMLSGIMNRTIRSGNTPNGLLNVFRKKFIIPVTTAALVIFSLVISDSFNTTEDDVIYSNSMEFLLEEHDFVIADNAFSPASVYFVDEILTDTQGNQNKDRNN